MRRLRELHESEAMIGIVGIEEIARESQELARVLLHQKWIAARAVFRDAHRRLLANRR